MKLSELHSSTSGSPIRNIAGGGGAEAMSNQRVQGERVEENRTTETIQGIGSGQSPAGGRRLGAQQGLGGETRTGQAAEGNRKA